MAPRTGLQLLHTAALLVTVAYLSCGPVLAVQVFQFNDATPAGQVLAGRQCLPGDVDASSVTEKISPCAVKVAGGLPAACASVPGLAAFYNCYTNSVNQPIIVSADVAWSRMQTSLTSRCQGNALPSLTPRQLAVYNLLCLDGSLLSDCDRRLEERGALDVQGMLRRERLVDHILQILVAAEGPGAAEIRAAWYSCSQSLYTGGDTARRYSSKMAAVTCFMQFLASETEGYIPADILFYIVGVIVPQEYSALFKQLETRCGPPAGYVDVKPDVFLKCWITEGALIVAAYESNLVASAVPDSCTISV